MRACLRCGETLEADAHRSRKYCSRRCVEATSRDRLPQVACGVADCGKTTFSSNLCAQHYNASRRHGIGDVGYQALLIAQENACIVCGFAGGKLVVDHNHKCCPGSQSCGDCVRGLLCNNCNTGLGMFADSPARLRTAALYLERAV